MLLGDSHRGERLLAERSGRAPGELGEATKGIVQVCATAATSARMAATERLQSCQ